MIFDLIATLGGMILPQVFGLVKNKMASKNDERQTINSLASTNPEVLPQYLDATSKVTKTQIEWFNRDVIGTPATWVINLRSAIRPVGVILAFGVLGVMLVWPEANINGQEIVLRDPGIKLFCEGIIGSWFGSRFDRS